jgi:hypothetical protein
MNLRAYYLVFLSASHAARAMMSEVECGPPVPKGCRPLSWRMKLMIHQKCYGQVQLKGCLYYHLVWLPEPLHLILLGTECAATDC